MGPHDKTDAIDGLRTGSASRKTFWQTWQDAYEKLWSGEPIPHASLYTRASDTISSAKEPEQVAKKGAVAQDGYLSYLWNVIRSPVKLEGPTGISQAEKTGSISKVKGSSPLPPPSPIDRAAVNLYIREMRTILERWQEEASQVNQKQYLEKLLIEVLKKQSQAYSEGIGSAISQSMLLSEEDKQLKLKVRTVHGKVDEITGQASFYGKINGWLKTASFALTISAFAIPLLAQGDIRTSLALANTVSQFTLLGADAITNFMKSHLDRRLGIQQAEHCTLRGRREIVQFHKEAYLERMQSDHQCQLKMYSLMNQLARNNMQTSQIILSDNPASAA